MNRKKKKKKKLARLSNANIFHDSRTQRLKVKYVKYVLC